MAGEDDHEGGWGTAHRQAGMGDDLSRILSLSDGIFAFAMTLLVIQLTVPSGVCQTLVSSNACSSALASALADHRVVFFAYVLTFLIISLWWTSHTRVFRFIRQFDGLLVWLNLLFLLTIAVSPFALGVFQAYSETRVAVILFAGVEATSGLLLSATWWYAQHERFIVPHADPRVLRYLSLRIGLSPLAFVVSIPVALVDANVAPYVWFGIFLPFLILRRVQGG